MMTKPFGIHRYLLEAIEEVQGETGRFVSDSELAQATSISLDNLRLSIEVLETGGWVEVAHTEPGLKAAVTPHGRLALRQTQRYPSKESPASTFVTDTSVQSSLWIEFDESKNCIVHTKLDFNDGKGAVGRTYVRLNILNECRQIIRNCRIVLDHIAEISMHGTLRVEYLTPMRLLWAKEPGGEHGLGRDIYPSSHSVVDLLYTVSDGTNHGIVLRDTQHTGGGLLTFNKRYRFWIAATAEDVDPVEIVLDVACGPNRSDVRVFEPRTLVIRSRPKINQTGSQANDGTSDGRITK